MLMNIACGSCSGCGACVAVCPVKAITVAVSKDGFYAARVNSGLCKECGLCNKTCPQNIVEDETIHCASKIAVSARTNEVEAFNSSSGGIGYSLMKYAIDHGMKVIGTRYDVNENKAVVDIAETIDELQAFRTSKYTQADPADVIKLVIETPGKYLMVGTPCQIAGLKKAALSKGRINDFIFVDFFCHGVPSPGIWHRYLEDQKIETKNIENVTYRDKKHGYHHFVISIEYKGGEIWESKSRDKDPYYRMYDDGYALSDACYHCAVRSETSLADIRIGDYWNPQFSKDKVYWSRVVCLTSQGEEFFDGIRDDLTVDEYQGKYSVNKLTKPNLKEVRGILFSNLRDGLTLEKIRHKYKKKIPLKHRLIDWCKRAYTYKVVVR
jgi:coenzyme F420-reducing hydrogenase beta subunit